MGDQPMPAATCLAGIKALRKNLAAENVEGAIQAVFDLNATNQLFPLYRGDCNGSLRGGLCTPAEWISVKARELYSHPEMLRPQAADFRRLIEEFAALRASDLERCSADVKAGIAAGDLPAANKAYARFRSLGGADEELLAALQTAEVNKFLADDQKRVGTEGPKFTSGANRWYETTVYAVKTARIPSPCSRFGPDARSDALTNTAPFRLSCSTWASRRYRQLTRDELEKIRAAQSEILKLPPTERPALRSRVSPIVSNESDATCPAGMKLGVAIDYRMIDACLQSRGGDERDCNKLLAEGTQVVEFGCSAILSQEEYCPGGDIGWSDGEHPCSITRCPPGLQRLAADTEGHIDGCYKCPVGSIDVKETLAAGGSTEFGIGVQVGRGVLQKVLCKEGPPPTAKPPKRRQR